MIKVLLVGLTLIVLVVLLALVVFVFGPMFFLFRSAEAAMKAGATFMDALTETDLLIWIAKAEGFFAQYPDRPEMLYSSRLPAELLDLKIMRVDVWPARGRDPIFSSGPESVSFVWMGGFDHTLLHIERVPGGGHRVVARYNDYRHMQLFPPEIDVGEP